ncbi:hypothetical protein SDJN03_16395, partial [Cucurbita argyrosperma subsp. sororia]
MRKGENGSPVFDVFPVTIPAADPLASSTTRDEPCQQSSSHLSAFPKRAPSPQNQLQKFSLQVFQRAQITGGSSLLSPFYSLHLLAPFIATGYSVSESWRLILLFASFDVTPFSRAPLGSVMGHRGGLHGPQF